MFTEIVYIFWVTGDGSRDTGGAGVCNAFLLFCFAFVFFSVNTEITHSILKRTIICNADLMEVSWLILT